MILAVITYFLDDLSREDLPSSLRVLAEKYSLEIAVTPDMRVSEEDVKRVKERYGSHVVFVVVYAQRGGDFVLVRYARLTCSDDLHRPLESMS